MVVAAGRRCMSGKASPASPKRMVVLEYKYAAADMEELAAKRAPFRPEHLAHASAWVSAGKLALGGAFGDLPPGGLLVFSGVTAEEVTAFAKEDPYVRHGLVSSFTVRPWTVVVEA